MVAAQAGVSRQTIWNWESGHGGPRPEQLRALEAWRPGLLVALGLVPANAEPSP
jgi:transcriptional regulator with XRE-family HTH domain